MIALACDHTGVALKGELAKMLDEMGLEWKDFGNYDAANRDDDYPVFGYRAAKAVASGDAHQQNKWIEDNGIRSMQMSAISSHLTRAGFIQEKGAFRRQYVITDKGKAAIA